MKAFNLNFLTYFLTLSLIPCFVTAKMTEVNSAQVNCKKLVKLLKSEKVIKVNDRLYSIDATQCAKILKTDEGKIELQSGFEIVKNNNMCTLNYSCDAKKSDSF
jgi:hypothetical protein